ncbi:hypothetical protein ACHAP8_012183 [Fusarium lateritium]
MDPLSITTACIGLIGAVATTTLSVTNFTRECREARSDLTSINGELSQLQLILELLRDDTTASDDRILPESLQEQILSIIDNCSAVVSKINLVLDKHSGKVGALKWATFGKNEVIGLRISLEAHRASLNLALELVSVSLSKAIKNDTTAIRTDVHDIKQDTSQISQIMDELTRLRAIVAGGDVPAATIGQNYVLQQYLDDLTSYAETVCNDVEWETNSSVQALSHSSSRSGLQKESPAPVIQIETSADTSSQVASLPNSPAYDEGGDTCLQPTRSVSTGDTSQNTSQINVPTVIDRYTANINGNYFLLWDTSGSEDYDVLREISYRDIDVALICFQIGSPDTLVNVKEKWICEVSRFMSDVPFILVGLKEDLRYDPETIKKPKNENQQPVSWDQVIHPVR